MFGASATIAGEALALPDERSVPTLAWIAGGVGVVVGAVGLGYALGGTHCAPISTGPGSMFRRECGAVTSDAMFGTMLAIWSLPLMAPVVIYVIRDALRQDVALTFAPGGVTLHGSF